MADHVGQQLGNYRLLHLLGEGGFAEVYLGEHVYLKTQAAIKVLHTRLVKNDLEGFLNEARTIARLEHPHIVRVLEFGVEGDIPFLVMSYARNGSLRQCHPRASRLPLTTIVKYVRQIADALQYAHDEKLIHRDVKPENMLVGRRNEILLSDFGIALIAQSSRYQSTQDVVGTVAYMSPEQIQGKPRPASDQYSLAVVIYEWLSGDPPFHGSFTELCAQHMFALPPPLQEKVPGVPSQVEQVVLKALAKEPQQRFASVQIFANTLEQASQSEQPTFVSPQSDFRPIQSLPPTQPAFVSPPLGVRPHPYNSHSVEVRDLTSLPTNTVTLPEEYGVETQNEEGLKAKAKQKAPTEAQRPDKERQQRQHRLAGSQTNQRQARNKGPMQRTSSQRQWLLIGGVLLLFALIIGAFIVISHQPSGGQSGPTQASSQVFHAVTNVDPNLLATVATGGVQNPLHAVKGPPPILVGPTGKPQFLYIGAEYCPYCAAQRWATVVALSRFGIFSKLYQTTSSSTDAYPSTPTFTFYTGHYGGSFYTSKYIDFVPVETLGNVQDSSGNYATLQTPTTEQQNLLNTYDVPPYTTQSGSIPFIDIANQYIISGASYSPQDLQGLQWQDIANNLSDPTSTVGKDILGTANYMTAGICMTTHQQPGSVCNTAVIQKIEQSLGKSSVVPDGAQLAIAGQLDAVTRREEA